jgi:hypothetical protein
MGRSVNATSGRKIATAAITLALLLLSFSVGCAQVVPAAPPKSAIDTKSAAPTKHTVDFAITYTTERASAVGGGYFWLQGGSVEAGIVLWHGLGVAESFTATHTSSVGSPNVPVAGSQKNVPLSLMSFTLGPRYRWNVPARFSPPGIQSSVFGEAMIGGVSGFDSLFPTSNGSTSAVPSLAAQIGFGIDLRLERYIDLRPMELFLVRTQLPNGANSVQNDLRFSSGIVLHTESKANPPRQKSTAKPHRKKSTECQAQPAASDWFHRLLRRYGRCRNHS